MDWLPWLTPFLLGATAYPLIVSGCALETTGLASASDRLLLLTFPNLPQLGAVPVTNLTVDFEVTAGQYVKKAPAIPTLLVAAASGQAGPIAVSVPVDEQTPVTCTCRVLLHRQQWENSLPTIGPISGSVTTSHKTIAFTLSYVGWPGESDYNPNNFKVAADV